MIHAFLRDNMWRILFLILPLTLSQLDAAYVLTSSGLKNTKTVAVYSCEEHFRIASEAFEKENWEIAEENFAIVSTNFPNSSLGADATFFYGVCLYELGEYDLANECLTDYLKKQSTPKYFQDAMCYKFYIAEEFRQGARRRFLGTKQLPKLATANTLCLQIYDEVIATIPCHDYAAYSLYAKGYMLWLRGEYQASVEAFQTLIRRFPKHELAPNAYLSINRVYLEECIWEFQNPDLLQLAELNCRRFKMDYPRDERCDQAYDDFNQIKETYANGLYRTGRFYEKQCQPSASLIYYQSAVKQFPNTQVAEKCRYRIMCLDPDLLEKLEPESA